MRIVGYMRHITEIKKNIAVGICLFLTMAPLIGSFISADTQSGKLIGHYTPYIHLTIPQLSGLPFAESTGAFWGLCILIIGIVSFTLYFFRQYTGGLRFLLYLTILYCLLRASGAILINAFLIFTYNKNEIIFVILAIITDFVWAFICYISSKQLYSKEINN